ncbi:MAG: hypothetical protein ABI601_10975 [bacterium]
MRCPSDLAPHRIALHAALNVAAVVGALLVIVAPFMVFLATGP